MSNITLHPFIKENVAPYLADHIGVYDINTGKKVGKIPLSTFKPEYSERLYRFGILSDVHRQSSQTTDNAEDLRRALQFFNQKESVEFTVICGDISQTGTEEEFQMYESSKNTYSSDTSVYTTSGNHDCGGSGKTIDDNKWESNIGLSKTFELSKHGDHFLFLGMTKWNLGSSGTPYSEEDIDWLAGKLEEYSNDRCFIITHLFFPQYSGNFKEIYPTYNWLGGSQLTRLKDLIDSHSNTMWFNGHSHWTWWLQDYESKANIYRPEGGGWAVHIPSCASPITSDGISTREELPDESEGAIIDVYDTYIDIRGLDIKTGKYIPMAQYRLDFAKPNTDALTYDELLAKYSYNDLDISNIIPGESFVLNDASNYLNLNNQTVVIDLIGDVNGTIMNQGVFSIGENISLWGGNCLHAFYPPTTGESDDPENERPNHIELNFTFQGRSGISFFRLTVPYIPDDGRINFGIGKAGIYLNGKLIINERGEFGPGIEKYNTGTFEWKNMMLSKNNLVIGSVEGDTRSYATYHSVRVFDGALTEPELLLATKVDEVEVNIDDIYAGGTLLDISGIIPGQKFYVNDSTNYVDLNNQSVVFDITGDVESTDQCVISLGTAISAWMGPNMHVYYPKLDGSVGNAPGDILYNHVEIDFTSTDKFIRYMFDDIKTDHHIRLAISKNGVYVNGELVINANDTIGENTRKTYNGGGNMTWEAWINKTLEYTNLRIGSQEGQTRSWATYNEVTIFNSVLSELQLAKISSISPISQR